MSARITVRVPPDLLKQAKRKAATEGRTLTSLIIAALRVAIAEQRRDAKRKRVMPRVSKATGGLMPGIDLSDSAALQQMEDLEYVQHLQQLK